MTLAQLLGEICAALNAGDDHRALRLCEQYHRQTGQRLEITSSSSGHGVSVVGRG